MQNKSAKLLFLGIDNAGKTTLMHMLRDNKLVQHTPTRNPTSEQMQLGNINIQAIDLGGHEAARKLWKDYYYAIDAIVYIVDAAADEKRMDESRTEFLNVCEAKELDGIPILILGNKIDLPSACSHVQLLELFGIANDCTGKGIVALPRNMRPLEVFMCSIAEKHGFREGFVWLSQYLK
ncbi:MAG: GTP-binding protein [Nitrosomonas sp.]|nr:GTP-binding protein [Nitrosomonas sp.]